MKSMISTASAALAVATALAAPPVLAAEKTAPRFEVTITNITKLQTFTPILVASHKAGVTLFSLGQPASTEMEILAEAGDVAPLTELLESMPEVKEVTNSAANLGPGQSVTLSVASGGGFDHLSVAAMLIPTNDGFFARKWESAPRGSRKMSFLSPAYDAGTERNDELCISIPGPGDVCQGEGYNPSREGAEGYVHIHSAIHGIGDLDESVWDWRNPVAQIAVKRID